MEPAAPRWLWGHQPPSLLPSSDVEIQLRYPSYMTPVLHARNVGSGNTTVDKAQARKELSLESKWGGAVGRGDSDKRNDHRETE